MSPNWGTASDETDRFVLQYCLLSEPLLQIRLKLTFETPTLASINDLYVSVYVCVFICHILIYTIHMCTSSVTHSPSSHVYRAVQVHEN